MFIIPAIILGTGMSAATMRYTRTMMLEVLRQASTPEERKAQWRANPGPFTFTIVGRPDEDKMWAIIDGFYRRRLNPQAVADFWVSVYTDPDSRVERLRQIKCPTLIMLGEHDIRFLESSELMAKEIPNAKHVIMPGVGHMTTIEDPQGTVKELLDFLDSVSARKH